MELVGQRVKLHDLKAKSYLNDSYGVTTAWDDSKGRVSVKLDSGEVVAIKLDNLTPIPAMSQALDPAAMPPLHAACAKGDLASVMKLLEAKADANAGDPANRGITPLQDACGNGQLDVAKLLFKHGADANNANENGNTPLVAACGNGYVAVAKLLLEHGADKDTRDVTGETPLFAACLHGELDVVKLLFEHGADAKVWSNTYLRDTGCTPLDIAYQQGHEEIVNLLLAKDSVAVSHLHDACMNGNLATVMKLLEAKADVNAADPANAGMTPLLYAFMNGHLDVVKLLLEHGADANKAVDKGGTALFPACKSSDLDLVLACAERICSWEGGHELGIADPGGPGHT